MNNIKYFYLEDIFTKFERGKIHSKDDLPEGNSYFYVGAKKKNNGVMYLCGYDENLISKGNCLVFICNGEGSVGYCNYMDRDFFASGDLVLAYSNDLNKYTALYLATILDLERPKYSFGRKYGKYVKKTLIPLPVNQNNEPDWKKIESFVKDKIIPQLPLKSKDVWNKRFKRSPINKEKISLNEREWNWFEFGSLIDTPTKGVAYNFNVLTECYSTDEGAIQYITRTDTNNGCKCFVKNEEFKGIEKGNAITIGDTTASIYYHADDFICGDHIVIIRAKWLNKYTASFVLTLLCKEKFRYNYGRSLKIDKIKTTRIKLPCKIDANDNPDWQFMEDYIKSLPYSANI
jgi:hypothetical protein